MMSLLLSVIIIHMLCQWIHTCRSTYRQFSVIFTLYSLGCWSVLCQSRRPHSGLFSEVSKKLDPSSDTKLTQTLRPSVCWISQRSTSWFSIRVTCESPSFLKCKCTYVRSADWSMFSLNVVHFSHSAWRTYLSKAVNDWRPCSANCQLLCHFLWAFVHTFQAKQTAGREAHDNSLWYMHRHFYSENTRLFWQWLSASFSCCDVAYVSLVELWWFSSEEPAFISFCSQALTVSCRLSECRSF